MAQCEHEWRAADRTILHPRLQPVVHSGGVNRKVVVSGVKKSDRTGRLTRPTRYIWHFCKMCDLKWKPHQISRTSRIAPPQWHFACTCAAHGCSGDTRPRSLFQCTAQAIKGCFFCQRKCLKKKIKLLSMYICVPALQELTLTATFVISATSSAARDSSTKRE